MHCWNKLRTQPKWLGKLDEMSGAKTCNKKQKTNPLLNIVASLPIQTRDGDITSLEENTLLRPAGKKKAKAALLQERKKSVTTTLDNMWAQKKEFDVEKEVKKEDRFKRAMDLEQERVQNEKLLVEVRQQEVQLQKQRDEERIMTMDLTVLPEEQKKYYLSLRAKIMSQLPSV